MVRHPRLAVGDGLAVARALGRRASMLSELGDPAAESALRDAAEAFGRLGLIAMQRSMLFNLCVVHAATSHPEAVLRSAHEAWSLPPEPEPGT